MSDRQAILERLKRIISSHQQIPESNIKLEDSVANLIDLTHSGSQDDCGTSRRRTRDTSLFGLDCGNLFTYNLESYFDIQMSEDEEKSIVTVGQLYEFILSKIPRHGEGAGLQASITGELQKKFSEYTGISQFEIHRASNLNNIFPLKGRYRKWEEFKKKLGLSLPSLTYSKGVKILLYLILPLISLGITLACEVIRDSGIWLIAPVSILLSICFIVAVRKLILLLKLNVHHFSKEYATVEELSRWILLDNSSKDIRLNLKLPATELLSKQEVWDILDNLISSSGFFICQEISSETRFVDIYDNDY